MAKQQQNKAFTVAIMGLAAVAAAMVIFYYLQNHFRKPDGAEEGAGAVGEEEGQLLQPQEGRSEFAGLYAATDGTMEAAGKRITSFTVSNTDGVLTGSVKIDTIGSDDATTVGCNDVRIDGKEFFMKCQNATAGIISLNGAWTKGEAGAISVAGKVLWNQNGSLLLDVSRNFQLLPN